MNNKIILVGPGGHSKNIIEIIEIQKKYKIVGLLGLEKDLNKQIYKYKVIGNDADIKRVREICDSAFISIGQIKSFQPRLEISQKLEFLKFHIPKIISNKSFVSKYSEIKEGCLINNGAIVSAGCSIGKHCIINSNALIEHDVLIEDFCHISTGAIINGGTKIGFGSFIGSGSIIREGLTLPPQTVISSGSTIMGWPLKV